MHKMMHMVNFGYATLTLIRALLARTLLVASHYAAATPSTFLITSTIVALGKAPTAICGCPLSGTKRIEGML